MEIIDNAEIDDIVDENKTHISLIKDIDKDDDKINKNGSLKKIIEE